MKEQDYVLKENQKKVNKKNHMNHLSLKFKYLHSFFKLGYSYNDFLNYELYKKNNKEMKEYVTIKKQKKFYEIVNSSHHENEFSYKPNFLKNFKKYIIQDLFVSEGIEELKKFLEKHSEFIIKPFDDLSIQKTEKMYSKDIVNIEEFYEKLKNERLFLEEYVAQHKISDIAPNSINTIKIITFAYDGKSEILFAYMELSDKKTLINDFQKSSLAILVDMDTGLLGGEACNKQCKSIEKHPKYNIQFDGFQIPNWNKVKKLVLESSLESRHIHVVTWEVAITDNEVTLIDGNPRVDFDLIQILSKRGRMDIIDHCIDVINECEGTEYKI